jgi:hypothetical protein
MAAPPGARRGRRFPISGLRPLLSPAPFCSKFLLFRLEKSFHNKDAKKRPGERKGNRINGEGSSSFLRGLCVIKIPAVCPLLVSIL